MSKARSTLYTQFIQVVEVKNYYYNWNELNLNVITISSELMLKKYRSKLSHCFLLIFFFHFIIFLFHNSSISFIIDDII